MNVKQMLPVAVVAAFAVGTLAPHAQTAPQKVGFVNVQTVLEAHAGNAAINDLRKKADTELKPLETQLNTIQQKGANATAAEKQQFNTLLDTYNAKAKTYQDQINAKVAPIEKDVDAAVATAAKANGFAIVMDQATAAQSGLVVYADNGADLTTAVVNQVKAKK
ncbi:OmpH family outer membrane protein [Deinococcus maricopensis]|uniref:Outer membrane chaperone Skp (OmpH) n=1 Tax=Deinococcus maricopensis (strain DSM 21211 / LMG 22137 / NRRL B-23946 / LB-34) TaxID=709986 RepID=E8U7F5_DEIML|nr:OmpH family outer membrane protein [Deinococcus maricopensis]ADV66994.1 outer membrane chaperone Skp (OmpH) [Deinococcus maricopensis DSM 21211]